jgi:hypothetical protein
LLAIELAATALLTGQAPESILSETTSEQDFREAQAEGRREIPIGFAHAELLALRFAGFPVATQIRQDYRELLR